MAYFREIPDVVYQSPLLRKLTSTESILAKNLFRKVKFLNHVKNNVSMFNKYHIRDGDRPETVAQKLYGNSALDFVVVLTAGINNILNEWPLDNKNLYNFTEDKYGIENLNSLHHYETSEIRDQDNRLIQPAGLNVDQYYTIEGPTRRFGEVSWKSIKPTGVESLNGNTLSVSDGIAVAVSNYRYETIENDKKRSIDVLRSSYLQQFLDDFRRIMRYDRNSQYLHPMLIGTENTRIVE